MQAWMSPAASAFYGSGIATGLALEPMIPVILHFGRKDQHIPPEHWAKIEAAHPDVPIYLYDADHGFFSPDRPPTVYDPDSARLARLRTLQLFHQNSGVKAEA